MNSASYWSTASGEPGDADPGQKAATQKVNLSGLPSRPTIMAPVAVVLNPDNYLSYLSPADAFQFEVARNLYIAVLGATIWDILVYTSDDVKILRMRRGISPVNICFVTSRFFALCYVLLSVLAKTIPLHNCGPIFIVIGCCCVLSILSSSFLFLRRVQAVYSNNRWVKNIFLALWLINGGFVITVPLGVHANRIPGTTYCIDSQPEHYVIAGGILPVIFDTCVFLAISYKIASSYSTQDAKVSWDTLVSGKALPRLSRAILHGGQQYYLITSSVYVILVILLGLPAIPPIYRNMFAFPSLSLTASMACRVCRNIVLLDLSEETVQIPVSDLKFARDRSIQQDAPQNVMRSSGFGSIFCADTLGATSTTTSQHGLPVETTELRIPERSLAYAATHQKLSQ